ncbi:MAG: hypothetical protein Q9184_003019 [Pyrenodesmia sp. 2 TL-2023]
MITNKAPSTRVWTQQDIDNAWQTRRIAGRTSLDLDTPLNELGIPHTERDVQAYFADQDVPFTDQHGRQNTRATGGYYRNAFIPHPLRGTIIAERNYSPRTQVDPPTAEVPPLHRWSDMVWIFWTRAAGAQASNLRFIFRHGVANGVTRAIIDHVTGSKDGEFRSPWPGRTFDMRADDGKALLGTPHGIGVAYLIADHSDVLGRKIPFARVFTAEDDENLEDRRRQITSDIDGDDGDDFQYYILWELRDTTTGDGPLRTQGSSMAQPSSVHQPISPASRNLYQALHSYLYNVEDPSSRSHAPVVTDITYQSVESPSLSSSEHSVAPPAVNDLGQTTSSPYHLSDSQPSTSPEMENLDRNSSRGYSPYFSNGSRNSSGTNTYAASNASLRGGDYQPRHNLMLPRTSPNLPLPSIEEAIYGPQTKWTSYTGDRPLYGRNPVCDDTCDKCRPGCPDECIDHCGPRTHVYHFRPGQKLTKIITIFLSPFEVIPPGFVCQEPHCSLAVHHAAGYYTFERGQRGGTVSLAPPDILDAMAKMETGRGGDEERLLVEWFRYVHEGCDYAIKVEKEEYEGEEAEGTMLSALNGRKALDGMFGDECVVDESERIE